MQSKKAGSLTFGHGGAEITAAEKPRKHEELGLCLALVVLLAWALFVGLSSVDWAALGHSVISLVAWIW